MMAISRYMGLENYVGNMEMTGGSEEAPAEETPAEETPAEETPKEETPAEETPSPEETPKEGETPAEETPAKETPKAEEPILYETPDGRQVTAEELQREWKDNFLPEFTRKSQKLADFERDANLNNTPKDVPEWKKEGYVPKDYAEVIEIAKAAALEQIADDAQAKIRQDQAVKDAVEAELTTLKTANPKLDENALFLHANKYGFSSLKSAHLNMSDMAKSAVNVEKRTVKNIQEREADPISTGPGGEALESTGYDPGEMSQFDGATDYLKHLQKKGT